ncbi:redoxin domain-containing protein [candidate division KSB1 bacterium]
MRKRIFPFFAILVFSVFSVSAFVSADDMKNELGNKVMDFTLEDVTTGKEHSLHKMLSKDGVNGAVLVFMSKNCPVSNACDERYVKLAEELKRDGILFVGINSNTTENVDEISESAKKMNYNFPVLKDWNNVIADQFDAQFTPHAYLISKEGVLLYKGRIDDNHRKPENVKERTLSNVVNEYSRGEDLSYNETKSVGCTIKRVKKYDSN